jgi:hypothetical protein
MRTVPGENPPLCGGCDLTGTGAGLAAGPLGSNVGVSGMEMARPQEGHRRAVSEHNAPQPEQVIMRTDCIAPRREVGKPLSKRFDSAVTTGLGINDTPADDVSRKSRPLGRVAARDDNGKEESWFDATEGARSKQDVVKGGWAKACAGREEARINVSLYPGLTP